MFGIPEDVLCKILFVVAGVLLKHFFPNLPLPFPAQDPEVAALKAKVEEAKKRAVAEVLANLK